jgi:UDP-glucuronate 4-epimerase
MKKLRGYDIFNLGESSTISLKNLISLVEKNCAKDARINQLPMQAGDVSITYADISKAKEKLGYHPTMDIETGVANYVKWYKESILQINSKTNIKIKHAK